MTFRLIVRESSPVRKHESEVEGSKINEKGHSGSHHNVINQRPPYIFRLPLEITTLSTAEARQERKMMVIIMNYV